MDPIEELYDFDPFGSSSWNPFTFGIPDGILSQGSRTKGVRRAQKVGSWLLAVRDAICILADEGYWTMEFGQHHLGTQPPKDRTATGDVFS